jgi:hypothetical protein
MPVHELRCTSGEPSCRQASLCLPCLADAIAQRGPQARTIGMMWAESICRGEHRGKKTWPTMAAKTLAIARRKVAALATDPRLLEPLALACSEGAAAWWRDRPAHYRIR